MKMHNFELIGWSFIESIFCFKGYDFRKMITENERITYLSGWARSRSIDTMIYSISIIVSVI